MRLATPLGFHDLLGVHPGSGTDLDAESSLDPNDSMVGGTRSATDHADLAECRLDPSQAPGRPRWLRNIPSRTTTEFAWVSKLQAAFPGVERERVERALDAFASVFISRWTDGSIYRPRVGAWKANRIIYAEQLIAHLSTHATYSCWLATRAFRTTRRICVDLDNHDDRPRAHARARAKVEDALRFLHIDPTDPRQVLVSPSPRGLHIHILLSHAIFTDDISHHFNYLGITPRSGRIELYPSQSHAVRVPFGANISAPGQPYERLAWLRWTESYLAGEVVEHDWSRLIQRFLRSPGDQADRHPTRQTESRPIRPQSASRVQPTNTIDPVSAYGQDQAPKLTFSVPSAPGRPGNCTGEHAMGPVRAAHEVPHEYDLILAREHRSKADAEYLWVHGILRPNTRHQVLLWLSQHLIWHLNVPEDQAVEELAAWALDTRHKSQTIQSDLRDGTDHTRTDIASIVRWCVTHQRPRPSSTRGSARKRLLSTAPGFTDQEIAAIKPHLDQAVPEHRPRLAHFALCVLEAARKAGQPDQAPDGQPGYLVHVAARVMRSWPDQSHMNYKASLEFFTSSKLLVLAKEKYQPKHGKGRARQWFLAVPYDAAAPTYDYDQAHVLLTGTPPSESESDPADAGVLAVAPTSPITRSIPVCGVHPDEHTDYQRPAGEQSAPSFDQCQVCPLPDLAPGQGERAPVKLAPLRLPEPADG
jgi:hypothetical protein